MADIPKEEKIAAAKKKLKQFQTKFRGVMQPVEVISTKFVENADIDRNLKQPNERNDESCRSVGTYFENRDAVTYNSENNVPEKAELSQSILISNDPSQLRDDSDNELKQTTLTDETGKLVAVVSENSPKSSAIFSLQLEEIKNKLHSENCKNITLQKEVTQQYTKISEITKALQLSNEKEKYGLELRMNFDDAGKTLDVLVQEKADLMSKLQLQNQYIKVSEFDFTEIEKRLKASLLRVSELENDVTTYKNDLRFQEEIKLNMIKLKKENEQLKQMNLELNEENFEIQHQLSTRLEKIKEIDVKCNELKTAQVHMELQTYAEINDISTQNQYTKCNPQLDRQIIELQSLISDLTNDRERTQLQYQTYVQHLTAENATLTKQVHEHTKQNEKLIKREKTLIEHVREIEKQLQKHICTQHRLAELQNIEEFEESKQYAENGNSSNSDDKNYPAKNMATNFTHYQDGKNNLSFQDMLRTVTTLKQQILDRDLRITKLEAELEIIRAETPSTSNILATIESEKLTASKAMSQNQELKQQLAEIQDAFIQVTNDKLEIADKLQSEQHKFKDIQFRFAEMEKRMKMVKENFFFKDEEMIRLARENSGLQLEISHLKAQSKIEIECLTEQMSDYTKVIDSPSKDLSGVFGFSNQDENASNFGGDLNVQRKQHNLNKTNVHNADIACVQAPSLEENDNSDIVSLPSTNNIATDEAMHKLQERFKLTMTEIADLTEEKHRLEHLVTQLQSETETIGEYITLYQTQRRLLKQREIEKDIQLYRISTDREALIDKIGELNQLVLLLLEQSGFTNLELTKISMKSGIGLVISDEDHPNELSPKMDNSNGKTQSEQIRSNDNSPQMTAGRIISLLSEIKNKNLSEDYSYDPEKLSNCSCCSGKLKVV